ncbi:sigma-54-dependent Fis family transcriptional regulator [Variovorax sp. HJSM1_2]|uniref:sigma-54-dependent Fis family transcriptional regulator n=1 Tax=Variovorax sp. HJSM1_2 TaxID=3366263 RepID=UPI003BCAD772
MSTRSPSGLAQPGSFDTSAAQSVQAAQAAGALIALAHQRSLAHGLQAHDAADLHALPDHALGELRARNLALCSHALPVMETLYQQIISTDSMVILTDSTGTILHALGDDDFLAKANRVALRPGVIWSEQSKGTNAIGTALVEGTPTQVHAGEHFLRANHFITCSCAPILDPAGHIMGALDVSGDQHSQNKHTMALVRMSAQMVENHVFHKSFEQQVLVYFHARPEFIGTLMQGMAAFTPDGRFLSANRSGQFQLGMPLRALQAHTCSSLMGMEMATVLAHCRSATPELLGMTLPSGVKVMARAEYHPFTQQRRFAFDVGRFDDVALAPAPSKPTPQSSPKPALSSLRYLNTGDPQLAQALQRVSKLLGRDIATLITGETGTGKELLAQAIHNDSPRRSGPFVALNCAAIPETLIESELFGYDDGAFTGARRKGSVGKIVQAHGGTLFLDEIGDMPLQMQARLLRVLQERSVTPLGGSRVVRVDVAVVCATHRNLRELIAAGRFREDLYYRLNGLVVKLPPLRERTDLAAVVARMLQNQAEATSPQGVGAEVMALFHSHAWPGNLRQLANVLRSAAVLAEGEAEIRHEHLPDDFLDECATQPKSQQPAYAPAAATPRLQQVTADAIAQALARHQGNVSAAARTLGVSRNTVYRYTKA